MVGATGLEPVTWICNGHDRVLARSTLESVEILHCLLEHDTAGDPMTGLSAAFDRAASATPELTPFDQRAEDSHRQRGRCRKWAT